MSMSEYVHGGITEWLNLPCTEIYDWLSVMQELNEEIKDNARKATDRK